MALLCANSGQHLFIDFFKKCLILLNSEEDCAVGEHRIRKTSGREVLIFPRSLAAPPPSPHHLLPEKVSSRDGGVELSARFDGQLLD